MEEVLTIDGHLRKARSYLFAIRVKWYDIGIELGVKVATLDSIRSKYSDDGDCLREMLKEWLKSISPSPTWTILAGVLRSEVINEGKVAKLIEGECMLRGLPVDGCDVCSEVFDCHRQSHLARCTQAFFD